MVALTMAKWTVMSSVSTQAAHSCPAASLSMLVMMTAVKSCGAVASSETSSSDFPVQQATALAAKHQWHQTNAELQLQRGSQTPSVVEACNCPAARQAPICHLRMCQELPQRRRGQALPEQQSPAARTELTRDLTQRGAGVLGRHRKNRHRKNRRLLTQATALDLP